MAYTDALLNTGCIAVAWASVRFFWSGRRSTVRAMLPGLLLGLSFFVKSSMALWFLIPLAAACLAPSRKLLLTVRQLAVLYATSSIFPLWSLIMLPQAPTFGARSSLSAAPHGFLHSARRALLPSLRQPAQQSRARRRLRFLLCDHCLRHLRCCCPALPYLAPPLRVVALPGCLRAPCFLRSFDARIFSQPVHVSRLLGIGAGSGNCALTSW